MDLFVQPPKDFIGLKILWTVSVRAQHLEDLSFIQHNYNIVDNLALFVY